MNKYNTAEEFLEAKGIEYKLASGGKELITACPFCQNPKPKCYVEDNTGRFYCFHCGNGGGWRGLIERFGEPEATLPEIPLKEHDGEQQDLPPIDSEIIEENHKKLFEPANQSILTYFYERRLYTIETLQKFKLGFDGRNVVIPIFNGAGECVNFKLKPNPTFPSTQKGMFSILGRGRKRLFNEILLTNKPESIIICEGEWDCMLLSQYGYDAVTSTAGANSFDSTWIPAFEGIEKIFICFDVDRNGVGQQAAKKTAKLFFDYGITVYIVNLPNPEGFETKMDVTDFFKKKGGKLNG